MPKAIISDSFETLSGAVQQGGKQIVSTVKKMGEDVLEQMGIKTPPPAQNDQNAAPAHTEEQYKKIEDSAKKRTLAHYREIQEQIKAIGDKRKQELPKEVTGKPGFSEEKAIKQLEEKKEEKLPPLPVRQSSRKTEVFRGASG